MFITKKRHEAEIAELEWARALAAEKGLKATALMARKFTGERAAREAAEAALERLLADLASGAITITEPVVEVP